MWEFKLRKREVRRGLTKAKNLLENLYVNEFSRLINFKDHIYAYD